MSLSLEDIIKKNENAHLSLYSERGFTVREVQRCENCKGECEIEITEDKGHSEGLVQSTKVCENCKGSGLMEVFVTIVRKPFKPKKNEQRD